MEKLVTWFKSSLTFLYRVLTKNGIINKQNQEQSASPASASSSEPDGMYPSTFTPLLVLNESI